MTPRTPANWAACVIPSLLTIFGTFAYYVEPAKAEVGKVRGASWGSTEMSVRATESAPLVREGGSHELRILAYRVQFAGEDVTALYRFAGDQLNQLSYSFDAEGRSCPKLAGKFEQVQAELSRELSAPQVVEEADSDNCNKTVKWVKDGTETLLKLSTKSGRSDLEVVYVPAN